MDVEKFVKEWLHGRINKTEELLPLSFEQEDFAQLVQAAITQDRKERVVYDDLICPHCSNIVCAKKYVVEP